MAMGGRESAHYLDFQKYCCKVLSRGGPVWLRTCLPHPRARAQATSIRTSSR